MNNFIQIEIFTEQTHVILDDVWINPDHIVGIKTVYPENTNGMFTDKFIVFLTSDGTQFESPMNIIEFIALIS